MVFNTKNSRLTIGVLNEDKANICVMYQHDDKVYVLAQTQVAQGQHQNLTLDKAVWDSLLEEIEGNK